MAVGTNLNAINENTVFRNNTFGYIDNNKQF